MSEFYTIIRDGGINDEFFEYDPVDDVEERDGCLLNGVIMMMKIVVALIVVTVLTGVILVVLTGCDLAKPKPGWSPSPSPERPLQTAVQEAP